MSMKVKTAQGWEDWGLTPVSIAKSGWEPLTSLLDDRIWDVIQLDTSQATDMWGFFSDMESITTVPMMDTSRVTDMGAMFQRCAQLVTIPALDMSSVTNADSMFTNCGQLTSIPALNTPNLTNTQFMFSNCTLLTSLPAFDTSKVTNMNGMLQRLNSLTEIPAFDMSAATQANITAGLNQYLNRFRAFGARYGFSLQGGQMQSEAIDEVFTNLGTAAGAQTLDVRNNPGSAGCDPSIATAKGWTVLR